MELFHRYLLVTVHVQHVEQRGTAGAHDQASATAELADRQLAVAVDGAENAFLLRRYLGLADGPVAVGVVNHQGSFNVMVEPIALHGSLRWLHRG